ncbi:hypothetical protein OEZ86_007838 [Tetradesmus obliquus]|uniref:Anaphase-promoting complex subunit 4 WD40 domain-containing protein n=1 Tax=Tetradesmus obliquus TaxID=3088 RepID=A0ABY8U4G2_TETOB|nr:hypothetical protein OEZ85_013046 [Tetradesmus obliquus]WIA36546.1 hypothetical protein OEZ86_007838 [Tetradesmus obliquus]
MFGAAAATGGINPNKDVQITPALADGITSVNFSPRANILVATCWDNNVYCWEVASNGQAAPKASTSHTQPVLCSSWNADGSAVFTGSCDKTVKMWNLATNQAQQVAQHDAPVRHCAFIPENNLLVTGSWDKTLKYWDLRTPNPVFSYNLPERCYALDVKHPLLVVGTADRHLLVFNLQNPSAPYKQLQSPLKWQTRCVACFPDKTGYLIGSIEGRVAVQHVEDSIGQTKNFTFKCHRDGNDIYAVNSIEFHPVHGTFVTAGSDGTYNFWDKDSKQRLKAMAKASYGAEPAPITCGSFNADGSIYAYGLSYDWSKGFQAYNPAQMPSYVQLHGTQEAEVKARPKTPATGRK